MQWESAVSYVVRGLNQHQAEGAAGYCPFDPSYFANLSIAPGTFALPREKVETELRENHLKCKVLELLDCKLFLSF